MADFISRDLALEAIKNLSRNVDFDNEAEERGWSNAIDLAYAAVVGIPIADARPERHGRWVEDGSGVILCSECGEEHEWEDYRATYCEDCGAKMDGKDGESDG